MPSLPQTSLLFFACLLLASTQGSPAQVIGRLKVESPSSNQTTLTPTEWPETLRLSWQFIAEISDEDAKNSLGARVAISLAEHGQLSQAITALNNLPPCAARYHAFARLSRIAELQQQPGTAKLLRSVASAGQAFLARGAAHTLRSLLVESAAVAGHSDQAETWLEQIDDPETRQLALAGLISALPPAVAASDPTPAWQELTSREIPMSQITRMYQAKGLLHLASRWLDRQDNQDRDLAAIRDVIQLGTEYALLSRMPVTDLLLDGIDGLRAAGFNNEVQRLLLQTSEHETATPSIYEDGPANCLRLAILHEQTAVTTQIDWRTLAETKLASFMGAEQIDALLLAASACAAMNELNTAAALWSRALNQADTNPNASVAWQTLARVALDLDTLPQPAAPPANLQERLRAKAAGFSE